MTTERDILNLLHNRYTSIREGTFADKWVRAEHVRLKLGHSRGDNRIADFIAADKHPGYPYGVGMSLHGHEVKVSRSDWLTELRDPDKAESFKRFMHYWWLVVSDPNIVKEGELPEGWGLMVQTRSGLRAKITAPRLTPEPLPLDLTISLMSAVSKTAHREPLYRNAPNAFVGSWTPKCAWCGTLAPCSLHQPRAN